MVVYPSAETSLGGEDPIARDRVRLCPHPVLHVGMPAEQVQRVGERSGGGFVSGQQEDEHLVADLAVGQRVSLVLRVEQ
jgi:hypothetical protein